MARPFIPLRSFIENINLVFRGLFYNAVVSLTIQRRIQESDEFGGGGEEENAVMT